MTWRAKISHAATVASSCGAALGTLVFAGAGGEGAGRDVHDASSEAAISFEAGDCAACHTAEGGKPFAGGRPVPTPFGTIYSTNITPDKDTGIGNWTQRAISTRRLHEGIGPGGKHYYPGVSLSLVTRSFVREDMRAIKAYLDVHSARVRRRTSRRSCHGRLPSAK